jgi:hypothetical protein
MHDFSISRSCAGGAFRRGLQVDHRKVVNANASHSLGFWQRATPHNFFCGEENSIF